MGWDAYALRSVDKVNNGEPQLDAEMQQVFEEATAELMRQTGNGGHCLCDGQLGGSWSKNCLSLATSISCDTAGNEEGLLVWPPETVQRANALADWSFPVEAIDLDYRVDGTVNSYEDDPNHLNLLTTIKNDARFFLQACAENGYAILFTG
jgi:hypothetical protein